MSQSLALRGEERAEARPAGTATSDVLAGARAMAPTMLAFLPFGLLVGAAVATSASPLTAWLSTWSIYGGAAHLAVLDVLGHGSGWLAAATVGVLVNVRLTAYATAMAPTWRTASWRARLVAALTLTDAVWALSNTRMPAADGAAAHRRFHLGAALTLWVGWPTMVTLGTLTGSWAESVPLFSLLPCLTLGSLVVPQLRHRPALAAAGAAATAAVATLPLPAGAAMMLTAAAGATAAWIVSRSRR